MSTNIQWTDETDNIIVVKGGGWWCRKCSEGCDNCHACGLNQLDYFGGNHLDYSGGAPELELKMEMIKGWARQRKPRRHFVASMTDVFGEWVPQEWIFTMLDGMAAAPAQTFQVLTKRAQIMARQVEYWLASRCLTRVPDNIWLGFSAENQFWFNVRAAQAIKLRNVCRVLWCSAEPLLGPIVPNLCTSERYGGRCDNHPNGCPQLDWIVFGGESGTKARDCSIGDLSLGIYLAARRGIRTFVKQVGARPIELGLRLKLKHKKGGDMEEWPSDLRVREFPEVRA